MGTLRKATEMSVKVLGWNGISVPATFTRPNSSTRPSNFRLARPAGSDPTPVTTPLSACTRVANGRTRLRSANSIAPSSSRTRTIDTGNVASGGVVGAGADVGGAAGVAAGDVGGGAP